MTKLARRTFVAALFGLLAAALPVSGAQAQQNSSDEYTQDEILTAAKGFFGAATQGLAEVIQKVFSDYGQPNGYITGEEGSGAFGVGLRYGNGWLHRKNYADRRAYWQGPSIGFDVGGNASKVFTLVYDLPNAAALYHRFPGVDGSAYFIGGVGVNYQRSGDIVLAPIRTGVGLRLGANVGYLHYTREHSWNPF